MLLLIDNYDSFTWNLAQYFGELGEDVRVERNDALTLDGIAALAPARIVISSFRRTSGGAPSSPRYCARFQVNES